MLDFWYSERCSRDLKLVLSVLTCVIIYLFSNVQQLPSFLVGFGVILRMMIHLFRQFHRKINDQNKIKKWIEIGYSLLPFFIMLILIMQSSINHRFALITQGFGFVLIGFFLASIHSQRAKRYQ